MQLEYSVNQYGIKDIFSALHLKVLFYNDLFPQYFTVVNEVAYLPAQDTCPGHL